MLLKFGNSALILHVPSWPDRLKDNFLEEQENSFLFLFFSPVISDISAVLSKRNLDKNLPLHRETETQINILITELLYENMGRFFYFDLLMKTTMLALFSKFHST